MSSHVIATCAASRPKPYIFAPGIDRMVHDQSLARSDFAALDRLLLNKEFFESKSARVVVLPWV